MSEEIKKTTKKTKTSKAKATKKVKEETLNSIEEQVNSEVSNSINENVNVSFEPVAEVKKEKKEKKDNKVYYYFDKPSIYEDTHSPEFNLHYKGELMGEGVVKFLKIIHKDGTFGSVIPFSAIEGKFFLEKIDD